MQRKPVLAVGVLVVAFALSVAGILLLRPRTGGPSAESFAFRNGRGRNGELPVLWTAPDFSYPNQHGKTTTQQDLAGHVVIADFIFTQCVTVCPRITATMVLLQRRIPDPSLRFVSFSVDPDHDTPEVLAKYAQKWNAKENRWLLLSTEAKALAKTARDMRVGLEASDGGKDPIRHSSMFFLLDAQHRVRGIYSSSDDEAVQRLMNDAHTLSGGTVPVARHAVAEGATGPELYSALGCAACHEDNDLAPSLAGLKGREVKIEGGGHVTANDGYISESIVAPGSKVVAGFVRLMPSYGGQLTPDQLDRLVGYVSSIPAPSETGDTGETGADASSEAVAKLEVDPVCGMKVRVTDTTPHAEHAGKTFHFCSDHCRDEFAADPAKYDKH